MMDLTHLIEDFDEPDCFDESELWKAQRTERDILDILRSGRSPKRYEKVLGILNTVTRPFVLKGIHISRLR